LSASSRVRGRHALAVAAVLAGTWAGCSFPEHTFIPDEEFYGLDAGVGGASGSGATGGTGATGGSVGGNGGTGANGGTAGGGTGGTAGGTGGTAGGTGGSAGSGNEDCLNGQDDDGDTDVDCEDSDCTAGYTCSAPLPSGWTGPVVYYEGPAAGAPGCNASGGYPQPAQTASSGFNAGSPTCPTCSCGSPSGMSCSAEAVFFDGPSCGGSGCWGGSPAYCNGGLITVGSACKPQSMCSDATGLVPTSAVFTNAQASGGTCTSSFTGTENIPTPTFTNTVRACGGAPGSGTGCGAGAVCLPKPAPPFDSSVCIYKTGDVACPAGAWSQKSVFHLSFNDTRDCSACACGSATGNCGSTTLELFTDGVCQQGKSTLPGPDLGGCTNLQNDTTPIVAPNCNGFNGVSLSMRLVGTPSGGSCPATGGQVTGSATPTEPITFCCL
jgi:hypothetical protein